MAVKFNLILQDTIPLTATTHHFVFTTDLDSNLDFKAGQFLSLHFLCDGKEHRRNYSIANNPDNNTTLELAMAFVPNGLASTSLSSMKPGDKILASAPYGQFILKDEVPPQRYILIGTGTGVTPYLSMLNQLDYLLTKNELKEVVILQGVRTANDLLYREQFVEFANKHDSVKFIACYSRGTPDSAAGYEVAGYVQEQLKILNIDPENDIAYLCGNPQMVDDAFSLLQELGLDRKKIRREKYIPSR